MSVPLIGPDGRPYALDDDSKLDSVLKLGFRVETPETPQTTLEAAADIGKEAVAVSSGATFGALEGATAGGFGTVIGATGIPELKAGVRQAMEESPIATGAGELAGMVLSPINKLAPFIEGPRAATVLGRIGQRVVGGMPIGALYGAGQVVSDAALGDTQLTAEKLVTGGGLGMLLGGLGGGVGGVIEEGAGKLLPKLATVIKGSQSALDDVADHFAIKGLRATQAEVGKIPEADIPAVQAAVRDHLAISPTDALKSIAKERQATADALVKQLGLDVSIPAHADQEAATAILKDALVKKYGPAVGSALESIDASGQFPGGAKPAYSEILAELRGMSERVATNPAERDFAEPIIKKAIGYIDELGARPVGKDNGFAMLNRVKSTLADDINYGGQSTARSRIEKEVVHAIKEQIDSQIEKHAGAAASKEFMDAKRAYALLSHGLDEGLGRKAQTGADAISEMVKKAGLATPEAGRFSALNHAHNLAEHGASRAGGVALKDMIGAGAVAAATGSPFGLVSGLGIKFMREHGAAVVAQVADRLSKSPTMQAVAHSFAAALPQTVPQLGRYGPSLMLAAERSPAMALAQHIVTAQVDPEYSANAQMAGLTPESPAEHAAAIGKATDLAAIHAAMKAHEREIDDGFKAIVSGKKPPKSAPVLKTQDFGAKQLRREPAAAHKHIVERIRELASNPSALVDVVATNTEALGSAAPGVSAHMTAVADRAVKYLATQAEVPPKPGPLAREWVPNETERHAFALKLEAVQSPMSILRHAQAGTLTRLQLQAVAAVYPQFARQIQDKALEQLASGESVPYRARMGLSLLAGIDADGTMSPKAIAANQAAIAASCRSNEPTAPDESKLDIAGRAASPGQKAELEQEQSA